MPITRLEEKVEPLLIVMKRHLANRREPFCIYVGVKLYRQGSYLHGNLSLCFCSQCYKLWLAFRDKSNRPHLCSS